MVKAEIFEMVEAEAVVREGMSGRTTVKKPKINRTYHKINCFCSDPGKRAMIKKCKKALYHIIISCSFVIFKNLGWFRSMTIISIFSAINTIIPRSDPINIFTNIIYSYMILKSTKAEAKTMEVQQQNPSKNVNLKN